MFSRTALGFPVSTSWLAEQFDVSRITIRRALEALAADGWIEKKTGAGSVVRAQEQAGHRLSADFATLIPHLVEMDRRATAATAVVLLLCDSGRLRRRPKRRASPRVQMCKRPCVCGLRVGSHSRTLQLMCRKRSPSSYDEADLATQPLFRLLERSGVSVASAHQTVTAALATPDVAEALEVSVGSPLLFVQRIVRDANGQGVEHLSALYRPDLFRLEMGLARVGAGEARHWEPVIGGASS